MRRRFFSMVFLAVLAGPTLAEERTPLPKGPPPMQFVARIDDQGRLAVRMVVPDFPPPRGDRDDRPSRSGRGDRSTRDRDMPPPPTFREVTDRFDLRDVRAYDTDGREIDRDRLRDMLRKDMHILISGDGRKVDPFYLAIIKEGTPVLILPPPRQPERLGDRPDQRRDK